MPAISGRQKHVEALEQRVAVLEKALLLLGERAAQPGCPFDQVDWCLSSDGDQCPVQSEANCWAEWAKHEAGKQLAVIRRP